MSLPPGFLDELRNRTSLGQVAGRKVTWDTRKSNQGKGDLWAPCPFHQEKTASFHVDDRKGYYYCFGCHAKGDAIAFVRETENVGFMEAVEILAGEIGMPMPQRDPRAKEKTDRLTELSAVMEQAVQFYRLQLKTSLAGAARDYLARRGLSARALERWEIGFAPDSWQGVWDHLTGKGVTEDRLLATGLAKSSQKGGRAYDTFRNRIMFPIRDARGRAIAFGGRAMDPNDQAKYLNSPETDLFDKGRTLFNHGPAREAAGKGKPLIVAEGYMDVIALSEAGFAASVAPLGTAVTEAQLQLLWRISPEPIIALDGDSAGLRAAMRLIDLALPLLSSEQSLRFALMPPGQDPDDVIRSGGVPAMQVLVDDAQPLVSLLWRRETEGKVFDSPERKAALDKSLRDAIRKIADPSLRGHYGEEIKRLRWALFETRRPYVRGRKPEAASASPGARNSALAMPSQAAEDHVRAQAILAILAVHPGLVPEFAEDLEHLPGTGPDLAPLRQALQTAEDVPDLSAPDMQRCLESLLRLNHIRIIPAIRQRDNLEQARICLTEELAKLAAKQGAAQEIDDAIQDLSAHADEKVTWRLAQAAAAQSQAQHGQAEDKTEYETAPTGAKISRKERDAFDALLQEIDFSKHRRAQR